MKDTKENVPKVSKGKTDKEQIIINPPEKNVRPVEEKFAAAVKQHLIDDKTRIVLEAKSALFGIPMSVVEQVFIRGIVSETPSHLTKQQHSINRVNSFISFGEAFLDDQDLVPLEEKGMKGTGGAARPHIKVETNPYNGQRTHHVVDAKGNIVYSSNNPGEAKQHLARHYGSLFGEEKGVELDPSKREVGTDSLVKLYKQATPGQDLAELSNQLLDRYKEKAKKDADDLTAQGKHGKSLDRRVGVMKAVGKQIVNTTNNIRKALRKEESEVAEGGLWANIHAKRERIKRGSGERMRKPGSEGAPTSQNFADAAEEAKPKLNKPFRTPGGPKKFSVYVKSDKGNVKKVNFGDPNMEIKRDDPDRRKAYRSRHNCDNPGPKTKANYWSCRNWGSSPVAEEVDTLFMEVTTRYHLSKVPVGKTYVVEFIWRGQLRKVQLFFPSMTRPTLEQIKKQIERAFPTSIVKRFDFITGTANMPLLVVKEENQNNEEKVS